MKRLCHEVALEFFPLNAPDTHQGTQNSCFAPFCNVWVHFGSFHYCTKLGAKWAELVQIMQKFMPRSRVGMFCNERSRSTPLEPELRFWCVSYYLDAFGTISLPYETRCKTGRNGAFNAKVRATKSRRNLSLQTRPIHTISPKHMF